MRLERSNDFWILAYTPWGTPCCVRTTCDSHCNSCIGPACPHWQDRKEDLVRDIIGYLTFRGKVKYAKFPSGAQVGGSATDIILT